MKKYLKFTLLLLFTVFIFWFFGRNLDWTEVSRSLRQANAVYLILAVLVVCLGYLFRAIRWKVLLEPITKSSLKDLFATTTVGFAAIFFVGRTGEIVRPMWLPLRDPRVRPSAALVTLFVERIFDFASLICFFAVNLLWFKPPAGKENDFASVRLIGILLLVGVAFGMAFLYVYQRFAPQIIGWFETQRFIKNKLGQIFLSLLRQMSSALLILKDWKELVAVIWWTIALWFSIAIPTWLVIEAFDLPVNVGLSDALFVMGWAAVGSLVPTPGGAAGAFHAATAGGLIFLGFDKDKAAAISIAMHLVYFAPAVIFGIYYFLHGDISFKGFRSLLSSEHAVEEIESESPNRSIEFQSSS